MNFSNPINFSKRFLLTLSFILFVSATACAYTVVMRGGKRIEIPAQFAVTKTTITYEVSPGIYVTLQVTSIDIPATERANNELPGSLLKRAEGVLSAPRTNAGLQSSSSRQKRRVVTDRDLERFKRARVESEAAYEKRRVELGLPSLEESRRRTQQETESFRRELAERHAQEMQAESYWRERANELNTEIAATDAQIDFVRARLSETQRTSIPSLAVVSSAAYPFGYPYGYPYGYPGFNRPVHPAFGQVQPGVFAAPLWGAQITDRRSFGNGVTIGRSSLGSANMPHVFRSRAFYPPFGGLSSTTVFGAPFQSIDSFSQRPELVSWLDSLVAHRAGLQARFRMLEEEARRAGVPPGWLR